jgi:hypothetical protein
MVPDFVVNTADGADAPVTLPVITLPVAGRQLAAITGRILPVTPLISLPDNGALTRCERGADACHNLARFCCR